jgi:8-oxo-dGTP pyrophosphatase MutT (NUDIX family)
MSESQHEQSFKHQALDPDLQLIRDCIADPRTSSEIRNPHPEKPVSLNVRHNARSSAVLVPIVDADEPTLIVTRRQQKIRFGGHVCFPGGLQDDDDISMVATALRETREEINLGDEHIEVLGELGPYYTQAGFRIIPVVALVKPGYVLRANPHEVDEIYEISVRKVLDSKNYKLTWHSAERGHWAYLEDDIRIAGPTVSVMMGLYEALLNFRAFSRGCN